ncbi:MAG: hypothetical protein M1839_002583 [Geoglossum umbratile]|nr:MAG: hypothetical protein M1839_002583 [Geoglossum umbratile]
MTVRYDTARQKPGQSVKQFVSYLDELESDMSLYPEELGQQLLFAKLLPSLRQALCLYAQPPPTTRTELISRAIQLEANMKRSPEDEHMNGKRKREDSKGADPKRKPFQRNSSFKPRSKFRARQPDNPKQDGVTKALKEQRRKNNRCYTCGSNKHFASSCPEDPRRQQEEAS